MSIVNSEIIHSEQNGNKMVYTVKYTDHLANEFVYDYTLVQGSDINAHIATQIPLIEARQANDEVENAVGIAKEGVDPNITAQYQPQADYDRRALGQFMTLEDVQHFNEGLSLFLGMESRGGANANQRAAYLGITRETYDQLASRFGDLQGVQFFLNDNKNQRWEDIPEEML